MPLAVNQPVLDPAAVADAAGRLDGAPAHEIVRWAVGRFGTGLSATTSFADTVLVDVAMSVEPDLDVVFVDTGFHFAETLETMRRAQARYGLALRVARPDPVAADLWSDGTDACCLVRKVGPLDDALRGRAAWLSGLRRTDHPGRAHTPVVELDRRGLVKVNPLAAWTDDDVARYVDERGLIVNPLSAAGYGSIGCWPCTTPATGRDGRWADLDRVECGIHA